jgi:hypothetical protein
MALNSTDPVAIQLGSIGYSCGPVLMILNRMKGLCCVLVFLSGNWVRIRPRIQLQGSISGGTVFWCNSSSATLYHFFLILLQVEQQ